MGIYGYFYEFISLFFVSSPYRPFSHFPYPSNTWVQYGC